MPTGAGNELFRLGAADFEVVGRFADASNATLLVRLTDRDPRSIDEVAEALGRQPQVEDLDPTDLAVHKPARGEAPLWDFPAGTLHRREVAAYEVSAALGWNLVPATVLRDDGPFGPGSMQRFVPHDPEQHYFSLLEAGDADIVAQLQAMVVFDLVIDNADRKGGHVLLEIGDEGPGRIQVVDHGVSFHVERKIRTVAWDFGGQPIPQHLRDDVSRFGVALDDGSAGATFRTLLQADEVAALSERISEVAALRLFPLPVGDRPYPWPLL